LDATALSSTQKLMGLLNDILCKDQLDDTGFNLAITAFSFRQPSLLDIGVRQSIVFRDQ
jgi:hypothetical protein